MLFHSTYHVLQEFKIFFFTYIEYKLLIRSTVGFYHTPGKSTRNFHIFYLFFQTTKKTSLLRGPPRFKISYLLL